MPRQGGLIRCHLGKQVKEQGRLSFFVRKTESKIELFVLELIER